MVLPLLSHFGSVLFIFLAGIRIDPVFCLYTTLFNSDPYLRLVIISADIQDPALGGTIISGVLLVTEFHTQLILLTVIGIGTCHTVVNLADTVPVIEVFQKLIRELSLQIAVLAVTQGTLEDGVSEKPLSPGR